MIIKRGNVVSHSGAIEWGVGKVVEVTDLKATIQFSDGIIRKIASSHYTILHPADAASFVSPADSVAAPKVRAAAKRVKKVKPVEVLQAA
jgi:transcription elongation factor GreA-like protein